MVAFSKQCIQKIACSIFSVGISLLLLIADPVFANDVIKGTVVKILDGDSILVREGKTRHEIRLWGIDSPEYKQPYGNTARRQTEKLLKGKLVSVRVINQDRYGRLVGIVHTGSMNINEALVKQGGAWVYTTYCKQSICREWKKTERSARKNRVGLWGGKNPVPPWKWRHSANSR